MTKFVLAHCGNRLRMPVRFSAVSRLSLFKWWIYLSFALLFSLPVFAQPSPDFSANTTAGCAPLGVYFKDLTTGNPTSWNWDFGNGTLSNVQNPGITFDQPGTYTVTLVVRNADGTNGITKTNYITVYPSPTAAFSADHTIGCIPVNIQFTDKSTSTSGGITSWQWDFGDGVTSTASNPAHTYTNTGFYNITLTVTNSQGCKGALTQYRYLRIVQGVKAEFTNNNPVTCQAPYNITFSNQSSGPGNMTFQWDLGNGTNSTQFNPSTTYNAAGTYNVTLTATSEFGCSGSISKPVNLTGPATSIQVPDNVCQGVNVAFVNSSSVTPQKTLWDFGNGIQSTNTNDNTTYLTPGDYTVKLYNNYPTCKDSAFKVVHVNPGPSIDFNVTNATACQPPLAVTFQDASSSPIVNWVWHFGDGSSGNGSPITHQYNTADEFNVSVDFTDDKGCVGTLTKKAVVQIVPPKVAITSTGAGGCVPYTYTPSANVTSIDGVDTYTWDFGDGTIQTVLATDPPPVHTYANTGVYDITLTIKTKGGCTETTTEKGAVKVGTPPAPDFSISKIDACASDTIHFTDLTPDPVDDWTWDFGDGTTSKEQNPAHLYNDSGVFIIKLTAFNNRCPASITGKSVHIKPPIARFDFTINCNSLTVPFIDKSHIDPNPAVTTSYNWQFGDGTTSNIPNPSHPYSGYGIYPVTLTLTGGGCTHMFAANVNLVKELADFTIPTTVCRNANYTITSTNNSQYIKKYAWSIDGGNDITGNSTIVNFKTNGPHSIKLTITDINNCVDFKTVNVTVVSPTAKFTETSPGGCKNAIVTFTDQSTVSGAGSALTKWTIDFRDGKTESYTSAPFSHTFADTGEFVPHLTVEDAMGCIDTISLADTIFISQPQPWFNSDITKVCPSSAVHFADSSFGKRLTYLWDFGNGNTSVDKDPIYTYGGDNGTYSVKLVITDRGGCKDSVTRTGYITTIKPIPAYDIQDTLTICPPIETKFTSQAQNYDSLEWNFGDGATSSLLNPTHFYNLYGEYEAKLYVWGYGGCIDSTSKHVHVVDPGPRTTLTYSPLEACNELLVDFSVVALPDLKFSLAFGDGTIDSSMAATYQHFYRSPAFYSPVLVYTDKQGCIAGVGGPVIKVIGATPLFAIDKKKFCDSSLVNLTNYTIGNDPVVSRTWDFGDGSATSSDLSPSHFYRQPGLYTVSQSVTTQRGCSKTISDSIRVFRTPDPYIVGDSITCLNTTINLGGMLTIPDTVIYWKWDLGNNNTPTTQNVSVTFNNAGNYTVKLEAKNSFGCSDTTSKNIFVPETPVITVIDNPVIPVSTGITLPVTYGPEVVSYSWTPAQNLSCTDCPTPYANPKFTKRYTVKVTDQYGCTNTGDVTVTVVCNGLNYFIPNTFSPNGDGVNDIFAPRGVGLTRVNSMRIFNRWGEMVYERMNFMANDRTPTGGWDGSYKGKPASADVYVYIIEFVCENNAIVPVKGNVALVR
ncbi:MULTISPECIES: PKD domain-containing protein [Niastella]|uniref:PKD domain-containing protein n=1 Tax=Niastella soli TaxID=2821487 RepID=A0ABS3YM47_9BACT|nr:PKD domain-containing protein [Niastella soli]MBO9198947.1 PKD domain-containing protein [Niastella soli]